MHLSAETIDKALKHCRPWDDVCVDFQWEVGRSRLKPEQMNRSDFHSYLCAFLRLAAEVPLNGPARTFVAKKLIWLQEHAKAVLASAREFAAVALGASYNDPQLDVVKSPGVQGIRLLLEGHLDDYIADLQTTRDRPGCPYDPGVSTPETVRAVAGHLNMSDDAARYYLQLLALVYPRDVDTQRWNDWDAATLEAAARELLDRELIIEADRSRTGRRWFLPGRWLVGTNNDAPTETWKAPLYLMRRDTKIRPLLGSCPIIMPIGTLFQEVWKRCLSGDAPEYAELTTKKYRPRR